MIDASLPFITQLRYLVSPSELRGLTSDLAQTVPPLTRLTQKDGTPLLHDQMRPAASCASGVVIPWSKLTLGDPHFNASNGFPARPVYVEAVDFLPGLAGESRDFDANGPYIRNPPHRRQRPSTYSLQPGLFGQVLAPLEGEQPQAAQHAPPLRPDVPCETQPPITDLTAATGGPPQQQSSNLSAPGAALRWTSAAGGGGPADPAAGVGIAVCLRGTAGMPALPGSGASSASNASTARRAAR